MTDHRDDILIVDDRPENLHLLSDILTGAGYKVRRSLDGARALDAAQLAPPDLILLDILMPGMSGHEMCERLKSDRRTREIPVIFLSALDNISDKVKAFTVGGVDYITKPFQQEEVLARVTTHLNIQSLNRALKVQNDLLTEEVEHRRTAEAALQMALDNLKMAQDQIIAREKLAALGALTAGIAHEIRNPLNFINNYAESSVELADELAAELTSQIHRLDVDSLASSQTLLIDLKENAKTIHHHGQRAERIIHNMMQHAHMGESVYQLRNLNELLEDSIQLICHGKRAQDLVLAAEIHKDYDPNLQPVAVLPTEISRAFINLIDNALYALKQKKQRLGVEFTPTLSIQTQQQQGSVVISIRDNGMGIALADQGKIFDPFFTTKPPPEGTGLGLSMTHEIIVSQHQGVLEMKTEPGTYTEFIITLPAISR
ncbi:response regulator [Nodosilinea sp. LEGE 07088]|uniref:hybrid sensor histidine kinase/response regulator n=1 Tax=Nodosilinea sp. LEGE 07088 TaxID=2777968 RepID=UPI0018824BB1|nr:response regulator [Nodosilinea sp. LEGE 07088]MBE9137757.1 response regulator [Nodosilinea sp. LEGE 07088]